MPETPHVSNIHRTPLSEEIITERVLEVLDEPRSPRYNPQLFSNSDLSSDPVVEAEQRDPERLFTTDSSRRLHGVPNLAILHETSQHRIIVYLKAQGLSNKEVAEKTGLTQPWISQLCRQPWFRLKLVQELKEAGIDQISSVLKSSALDSVHTLIDLRDDPTTPKAVRRACADSLLDRYLGKAVTKIESTEGRSVTSPEIQAVENELAEVNRKLETKPKNDENP